MYGGLYGGFVGIDDRPAVGALVFPVQGLWIVPADGLQHPIAGVRRERWPEFLEGVQARVPMTLLLADQPVDDQWQPKGLSQLAGHQHLLPQHLAAMGAGGQYRLQGPGRVQRGLRAELFRR